MRSKLLIQLYLSDRTASLSLLWVDTELDSTLELSNSTQDLKKIIDEVDRPDLYTKKNESKEDYVEIVLEASE